MVNSLFRALPNNQNVRAYLKRGGAQFMVGGGGLQIIVIHQQERGWESYSVVIPRAALTSNANQLFDKRNKKCHCCVDLQAPECFSIN